MIEPVFAQVLHGSLGKGLYGGVDNVNETFGSLPLLKKD
jgi:hypothetical protein